MPAATTNEVREAVRETVQYRPSGDRNRPSRSQTTAAPLNPKPTSRRSHSEDRSPIQEKPRSSGKPRSKTKNSQHADVIDRLDFTGVGPMFHHDGPFDACAPSRNKQKSKAPMYAWSPGDLSQPSSGNGAYPSPYAYQAFSNDYPEPPKKKVDAIAEAWGIHEPEPFEDFSAGGGSGRHEGDTPASSIYNGKSATRRQHREDSPRATRRTGVPPPQPIFVPENADGDSSGSPPANSPGFPKRSKSLMQRIRKMRDAPNVPAAPEYETPSSPTSPTGAPPSEGYSRPTHKSQNSFLGRFGVKSNQSAPLPSQNEYSEPYIFIDNQNKALPATPGTDAYSQSTAYAPRYSDRRPSQQGDDRPQLNRKTSLLKKVGRAVRGK
ncbi:Pal1 cell morphology protein-domain-containing protein [Ephemerocybe angulata]|nr:Pal1 cell morphology protein-domain-containing protein [Tulosesus angulatus]